MDCRQASPHLEMFALGELDEPTRQAVDAHLHQCARCRSAAADLRSLIGRIEQAAQPCPADPALVSAVSARAWSQGARPRRRPWFAAALSLVGSAAAMWLLAVCLWRAWLRTIEPSRPPLATPVASLWQYRGTVAAAPSAEDALVIRGSAVYLLRRQGEQARPTALDTVTGQARWQADVHAVGPLTADDRSVYCLTPAGMGQVELTALDAASGEVRWQYEPDRVERSAAGRPCRAVPVGEGQVCWTTDTSVHMLRSDNGQRLWTCPIPNEGLLSAAVPAGDRLFVASANGLHVLSAETGRMIGRHPWPAPANRSARPILDLAGDRLFVALATADGGQVICLSAEDGQTVWRAEMERVHHLLAADGRLFVRTAAVHAMDAATGQPLWDRPATGCNPITWSAGVVYYVDAARTGGLIALDGRTGRKVWGLAGIRSCDAFVTAAGRGYLKTHDGVLRAVALQG